MTRNLNQAPAPDLGPTPKVIPSVNSRGHRKSNLFATFLFIVLILMVLGVGVAVAISKFIAHNKAESAAAQAEKSLPSDSPVGQMRKFLDTPPPAPGTTGGQTIAQTPGSTLPSLPSVAGAGTCPDGTTGSVVVGTDGRPVVTASGSIMRDCRSAREAVPGLRGNPGGGSPVPMGADGQQRPSRYAGDVMLTSPQTNGVGGGVMPVAFNAAANVGSAFGASLGGPAAANTHASLGGTANTSSAPSADNIGRGSPGANASQQGSIGALLNGSQTNAVTATRGSDPDLTLGEGKFIPCALSMKVVTEVSGLASCVVQDNIYSDNGRVLLVPKGSKANGEYQANMAQGQRRILILWNTLKGANNFTVSLASPIVDGLGTSGIGGYVDNRWGDRIGAAFLLSLVQDAIGYETAKATTSSGVNVFSNTSSTGNSMAQQVLSSTINIKPTVFTQQGDRAMIYVARDIDFSKFYVLSRN